MPDKSDPKFWNRLYHQNADGTFTDVTEKAGLSGMPQNRYGMGVAVGRLRQRRLRRPLRDRFRRQYALPQQRRRHLHRCHRKPPEWRPAAGARAPGFLTTTTTAGSTSSSPATWIGRSRTTAIAGRNKPGYRAYCHPDNYDGVTNILYHNNGDGTFTDVSEKAGIANPKGKGLGVSFADYDGDGFTDIFVANDSVQCFLYHNNGNGTFTEVGLLAGVGFNEDGKTFAGMGADFADYDNDGRPDIVVTDLSNERYRLFRQNGDGSFQDVTNQSGVGSATLSFAGWSTRFFDYDNDGWKDLFVAQGHVMDTIEKTAPNLKYLQPPLLLRNESGPFCKSGARRSLSGAMGWTRCCLWRHRQRRRHRRGGQQPGPETARAPQ